MLLIIVFKKIKVCNGVQLTGLGKEELANKIQGQQIAVVINCIVI